MTKEEKILELREAWLAALEAERAAWAALVAERPDLAEPIPDPLTDATG